MTTTQTVPDTQSTDTFPINGTDFVEFWVGNATQPPHYYRTALGFKLVGVSRSGDRDSRSRELPARAGQGPLRPHDARWGRTGRSPITCPARRRGPGHRVLGRRCTRRVTPRRSSAAPSRSRSPTVLEGRSWRGRHRGDPHLRRHHPLHRRAERTTGASSCPDSCRPAIAVQARRASASSTSITASATSSSAR